MTYADESFITAFCVDDNELIKDYGVMSSSIYMKQWALYRFTLVQHSEDYLQDILSTEELRSFIARLCWFLSDDAPHLHHYLPLPTPTCLMMVGAQLNASSAGNHEVCYYSFLGFVHTSTTRLLILIVRGNNHCFRPVTIRANVACRKTCCSLPSPTIRTSNARRKLYSPC